VAVCSGFSFDRIDRVVTINLPRIGYTAQNEEEFFAQLLEKMILAKDSLEIKRKILEKLTRSKFVSYIKSIYVISRNALISIGKTILDHRSFRDERGFCLNLVGERYCLRRM